MADRRGKNFKGISVRLLERASIGLVIAQHDTRGKMILPIIDLIINDTIFHHGGFTCFSFTPCDFPPVCAKTGSRKISTKRVFRRTVSFFIAVEVYGHVHNAIE
jgi:hypothetical protein